jgi:hypothetical protein
MVKGINLEMTEDYRCDLDTDNPQTVWKISAVDSIAVSISLAGNGRTAEEMMNLVRFGLKGVEHFRNAQGQEISFATEQITVQGETYAVAARRILKVIPLPYILKIGTRILELSSLSGEQEKN